MVVDGTGKIASLPVLSFQKSARSGRAMLHHLVGWIGSESRKQRTRGHWARWLGRTWAHVSYGFRVEPTWLEVNRIGIAMADLPDRFAGFRVVQLSDFHA